MKGTLKLLAAIMSSLFLAVAVSGATFVVNTTDDTQDANPGDGVCADAGMNCSLRAAISEANALAGPDIITLPAGTYTQVLVGADEDANAGGDWDISSDLTINGAGSANTIIQAAVSPGTASERVMQVVSTTVAVEINGVTLRHGNKTGTASTTTRGGGIRNVGTLTINDSVVTENNAPGSAGIRNERHITLNNVTVSNNTCSPTGGSCFGGGMYNTLATLGTIVINNSVFTSNTAAGTAANTFGFGAGVGIESASGFNLTITNSSFSNNIGSGNGTGGSNGTGIRLLANGPATVNITNSRFDANMGTGGSAIIGQGIAAFTSGAGSLTATLDGVTINNNSGISGTGMNLNATGGAMTVTMNNSTVANNDSSLAVGGIQFTNAGQTSGAASVLNIVNSTISGNTALGNGGGLGVEQPGTGTVAVNINFSTIASNKANNDNSGTESGGGIFNSGSGTINLKNTIVADNAIGTGGSAPDISGTVNSQDYNHIEDLTGATIGGTTTNNTTGDPDLGPLADNGGPTMTHSPASTSIVVNMIADGTNDCGTAITTDQRGASRPISGACDKGAVEYITASPVYLAGRVLSSDGRALSGVVVVLSGGSLPEEIAVQTNPFGRFRFNAIPSGQTYTVTLQAKEQTFVGRDIFLTGNLDNEVFTAEAEMVNVKQK